MHEYGIARDIMDTAKTAAQGRTIQGLSIEVGALSGVVDESLRFYLELLAEEEQLQRAVIDIVTVPALFSCSCGKIFSTPDPLDPCPGCRGFDRTPTGGTECILKTIEVADE